MPIALAAARRVRVHCCWLLLATACAGARSTPTATSSADGPERTCPVVPADASSSAVVTSEQRACIQGETGPCRGRCQQGDGAACAAVGHAVAPEDHQAGLQFYRRGCELGDLNACTNYGASLRAPEAGGPVSEAALRCSAGLFERACQGGEVWGCGMFGFALAEGSGVAQDLVRAKALLETTCQRLGHFACATLAKLYREGLLQPRDPGAVERAEVRACQTGYSDACEAAPQTGQ